LGRKAKSKLTPTTDSRAFHFCIVSVTNAL
jgi:hypothetical protein